MPIFVDEGSRVLVQGLTGEQGRFHAARMTGYGTRVVAGVTPGKGGTAVDGVPVFDAVEDAVAQTGANVAVIFVPAPFAADAILESAESLVPLVICVTEGIPVHDMARIHAHLACGNTPTRLIGPNCPGVISPGKANVGIIPGSVASPGHVGLVSRSGTLTYQIMDELTSMGIGQSTTVGIGGDPIVGTDFIDCLARFEQDPETASVVLIGEIGGEDEEKAAAYIAGHMSKPVVAYIAGFTAPAGKRMGHAGAIVSGSKGTAAAKAQALEAVGVRVGRHPSEVAGLVASVAG
ncbi:MAG TPA: succinate--CoA ligase subunit alpha [Actinomycetota bacterium]|nr:succinate--CoA ligase subunit alpha [Actinomycetota bacterium]